MAKYWIGQKILCPTFSKSLRDMSPRPSPKLGPWVQIPLTSWRPILISFSTWSYLPQRNTHFVQILYTAPQKKLFLGGVFICLLGNVMRVLDPFFSYQTRVKSPLHKLVQCCICHKTCCTSNQIEYCMKIYLFMPFWNMVWCTVYSDALSGTRKQINLTECLLAESLSKDLNEALKVFFKDTMNTVIWKKPTKIAKCHSRKNTWKWSYPRDTYAHKCDMMLPHRLVPSAAKLFGLPVSTVTGKSLISLTLARILIPALLKRSQVEERSFSQFL